MYLIHATFSTFASPYSHNYAASGGNDLTPATRPGVDWFQRAFAVAHPTLIDPSFATVNRHGAAGYPTLYLLARRGIVRFAAAGEVPYTELARAIAAAERAAR